MTGYQGTFVISWTQTELDGEHAPDPALITVGATWRWFGEAVRVDGPNDLLILRNAEGSAELQARAARAVARLVGGRAGTAPPRLGADAPETPHQSFTVTDGFHAYIVALIELPETATRLLVFDGRMPAAGTDLWVVERSLDLRPTRSSAPQGTICFTPGTLIDTPRGRRPVEALREGDLVATADNGAQPICWIGSCELSGARLHAMPGLRPVRITGDALGTGRPDADLLVSPQHRLLLRGDSARALFGETEVLVRACDLADGRRIRVEQGLRAVTYIHMMFECHEVVRANGIESESFHPASMRLDRITPEDRARLVALRPELARDPHSYGAPARRALSLSEAAILNHYRAA